MAWPPARFRETRPDRILALIRDNPFAQLVTVQDGQPCVDHLPILPARSEAAALPGTEAALPGTEAALPGTEAAGLEGPLSLIGHVSAANPVAGYDGPAMLVFSGPHAYVSPGDYATAPHVPTWNYAVVHIRGRISWFAPDDPQARDAVISLAAAMEAGRPSPWSAGQADAAALVDRLLPAIRAFRFEAAPGGIDARFKLGQNRSDADLRAAAAALSARKEEVGAWMAGVFAERSDPKR